jgi:hypothetical protein
MKSDDAIDKPRRLYFKTYLQLIRNSLGSNIFRNFYVHTETCGEFDALEDGYNACAFYVSSVLTIFGKLSGPHGTVDATKQDLLESGWQLVEKPQAGDVIIWEAQKFDTALQEHIGFSIGNGQAISISWKEKVPVKHDQSFGKANRKITQIFHLNTWD